MGELLPNSNCLNTSLVQHQHVTISNSTIHLQLHNHKTNKGKPLSVIIKQQHIHAQLRLYKNTLIFKQTITALCSLILFSSQSQCNIFKQSSTNFLFSVTISPSRYKLHSFRICACTQVTILGIPENEIKLVGRWKSNAFHRYSRLCNPHTTKL